jgi:pimeloyl-ACP methyl ester carboxylesterase
MTRRRLRSTLCRISLIIDLRSKGTISMKSLLVTLGLALLITPATAATPPVAAAAPAFAPTRFSITDKGAAGKPDVILIPGLGSARDVWDDEAKLLAPNYRLHLVQIDGFAGVPAGANAAKADETGTILPGIVEELHQYIATNKMHPVVIGHSLGGLLALMLADKHADDVRKLVIVDSLPFAAVLYSPAATVATVKGPANEMRQNLITKPDDRFAAMESITISGMVKDPAARKVVVNDTVTSDRTVFANAMYEDLTTDLRSDIAAIKTPTLMLYPYDSTLDGPSPAVTDAQYISAYKAMPNVTLMRIDDSRHFIMYDQPAKLDATLESFLK